jgi:hypothetical protein
MTSRKNTRNGTQTKFGESKCSHHDPRNLPGVDFSNTVVTEVGCGPVDRQSDGKGLISKVREFAGRLSRVDHPNTTEPVKGHAAPEEIEMHAPGEGKEIVVSYDVWRTVEERQSEHTDDESV